MIDKGRLVEILHFRHACKIFDTTKKIPKDDMDFILESGRLAPSSFGMEHWRFIAIRNDKLRKQIQPYCWNQPQITTCDTLVAVIAKPDAVSSKDYYTHSFQRRGLATEAERGYIEKYEGFISGLESIEAWCEKQCYLAASNMMNYAACIGVDSCPIEGFERENVEKILDIKDTERLALLIAFGHRVNPQSQKLRLPTDEIVSWVE